MIAGFLIIALTIVMFLRFLKKFSVFNARRLSSTRQAGGYIRRTGLCVMRLFIAY